MKIHQRYAIKIPLNDQNFKMQATEANNTKYNVFCREEISNLEYFTLISLQLE